LPVKNGFSGVIPALMSRTLGSFLGTREKLGARRCPLPSKNDRNISLSSCSPYFIMMKPHSAARGVLFPMLKSAFVRMDGEFRPFLEKCVRQFSASSDRHFHKSIQKSLG
jgi:hypothetical protein